MRGVQPFTPQQGALLTWGAAIRLFEHPQLYAVLNRRRVARAATSVGRGPEPAALLATVGAGGTVPLTVIILVASFPALAFRPGGDLLLVPSAYGLGHQQNPRIREPSCLTSLWQVGQATESLFHCLQTISVVRSSAHLSCDRQECCSAGQHGKDPPPVHEPANAPFA